MDLSQRALNTNPSAIGEVLHFAPKVKYNLALGIPFWTPPEDILKNAVSSEVHALNFYGPIIGNPSLLNKLKHKIENKNKLMNRSIIVTAGIDTSSQNHINIFLSRCQSGLFQHMSLTI